MVCFDFGRVGPVLRAPPVVPSGAEAVGLPDVAFGLLPAALEGFAGRPDGAAERDADGGVGFAAGFATDVLAVPPSTAGIGMISRHPGQRIFFPAALSGAFKVFLQFGQVRIISLAPCEYTRAGRL